ncbi:MAG: gliding motility-associated C-terminal domain-containing protein [Salibacteraceae bacterium]
MKGLSSLLLLWLSIVSPFTWSQDTFLKEINVSSTSRPSIFPASNGGWYLYAADETVVSKHNQCGDLEWVRDLDIVNDNCCIGDAIQVSNNNINVLTRDVNNGVYGYRVTQISSSGLINWSKVFSNTSKEYYPYAILTDVQGDLIVYGIENPIGGGPGFLTVMKLDQQGNLVWSKKIADGFVWGAAIATLDGGCLLRSGDQFIKLDVNGVLQWNIQIQAPGTYYYLAPIEVVDGYIFTKNKTGGSEIGFYKMDKSGNLMWNYGRFIGYSGNPLPLRSTGSNSFIAMFNIPKPNGLSPSIIEFDKDLNVRKQNVIGLPTHDLFISDFRLNSTGIPLITGTSGAFVQNLFMAKLDNDFKVGCDLNDTFSFNNEPVTVISNSVNIQNFQISGTDSPVTFVEPNYLGTNLCTYTENRTINLGEDTVICVNDSLLLENQSASSFQSYLWSTGETTASIYITSGDTYWVEASSPCITQVFRDTIIVQEFTIPQPPNWISDSVICGDEEIILDATIPGGSYLWQDGSTLPTYTVTGFGEYFVDVTSTPCIKRYKSQIKGCEDIFIPNVFTPNGDGVNDFFKVEYYGEQSYNIEIYNRWGALVFQNNHSGFSWGGTSSTGKIHPNGVYYYIITVGEKNYKGNLTLIK